MMIALPNEKYYSIPKEVLGKYALTKEIFEKELEIKLDSGSAAFVSNSFNAAWSPRIEPKEKESPSEPIRQFPENAEPVIDARG